MYILVKFNNRRKYEKDKSVYSCGDSYHPYGYRCCYFEEEGDYYIVDENGNDFALISGNPATATTCDVPDDAPLENCQRLGFTNCDEYTTCYK